MHTIRDPAQLNVKQPPVLEKPTFLLWEKVIIVCIQTFFVSWLIIIQSSNWQSTVEQNTLFWCEEHDLRSSIVGNLENNADYCDFNFPGASVGKSAQIRCNGPEWYGSAMDMMLWPMADIIYWCGRQQLLHLCINNFASVLRLGWIIYNVTYKSNYPKISCFY